MDDHDGESIRFNTAHATFNRAPNKNPINHILPCISHSEERNTVSDSYRCRQNSEDTEKSDSEKNACGQTNNKKTLKKHYKQWIKKFSVSRKSRSKSDERLKTDRTENVHKIEQHPLESNNCKEHVIDEEETDIDHDDLNMSRSAARLLREEDFSDLSNGNLSENQLSTVNSNISSEGRSALSSLDLYSVLAPFLSNEPTFNIEDRSFYAENEDDMRLLQILQYIQHVNGGMNLLFEYIQNHILVNYEDNQKSSDLQTSESEGELFDEINFEELIISDEETTTNEQNFHQLNLRQDTEVIVNELYDKTSESELQSHEVNIRVDYFPFYDSGSESSSETKLFEEFEREKNDLNIITNSDTVSLEEVHYYKIKNYLSEFENSDSSCDNLGESCQSIAPLESQEVNIGFNYIPLYDSGSESSSETNKSDSLCDTVGESSQFEGPISNYISCEADTVNMTDSSDNLSGFFPSLFSLTSYNSTTSVESSNFCETYLPGKISETQANNMPNVPDEFEKAESEIFEIEDVENHSKNSEEKCELASLQSCNIRNQSEIGNCFVNQELNNKSVNMEIEKECPVWEILKELESPFKWAPDITILKSNDLKLQDNIIEHLTGEY